MKSLQEYTTNIDENNINNDFQYDIISEGKALFINHGKDLDTIFKKFKAYNAFTKDNSHGNIYESYHCYENNDIAFTINEQTTATNYMKLVYKSLLSNLNAELYEYQQVNEAELNDMISSIQTAYKKTKETVAKGYEELKIKISEIGKLLKEIITNGIKSIKEMLKSLANIVFKLNCDIKTLFDKVGWGDDINEKTWNQLSKDYIDEMDKSDVKKNMDELNVYESFGNALKENNELLIESISNTLYPDIIFENDEKDKDNDDKSNERVGTVVKQGTTKGIRRTLKRIFINLTVQFIWCYGIPVFIQIICPYSLLVNIALMLCKLTWTVYKIYPMTKHFKEVWDNRHKYSRWELILQGLFGLWTIASMCHNAATIGIDTANLFDACKKATINIFKSNSALHSGIEPDAIMKSLDVFIDNMKNLKLPWDNFSKAYTELGNLFSKSLPDEIKNVIKQHGEVNVSKLIDDFGKDKYTNPNKYWNEVLYPKSIDMNDLMKHPVKPGTSTITALFDGTFSTKNSRTNDLVNAMIQWRKENNLPELSADTIVQGFNKYANDYCNKQGTIYGLQLDTNFVQWAIKKGLHCGNGGGGSSFDFSLNKDGHLGSVVCVGIKEITSEVVNKGKNILQSMNIVLPWMSINTREQGGFDVKLGADKEKNKYIYRIPKDGVTVTKMSEASNIIQKYNKAAYDEINDTLTKIKQDLESNASKSADNKTVSQYQKDVQKALDEIQKHEVIIYYGTRHKEAEDAENKSNKDEQTSENLNIISLHDYLINEGISFNYTQLVNSTNYFITYFKDYLHLKLKNLNAMIKKHESGPQGHVKPNLQQKKTDFRKLFDTFKFGKLHSADTLSNDILSRIFSGEDLGAAPDDAETARAKKKKAKAEKENTKNKQNDETATESLLYENDNNDDIITSFVTNLINTYSSAYTSFGKVTGGQVLGFADVDNPDKAIERLSNFLRCFHNLVFELITGKFKGTMNVDVDGDNKIVVKFSNNSKGTIATNSKLWEAFNELYKSIMEFKGTVFYDYINKQYTLNVGQVNESEASDTTPDEEKKQEEPKKSKKHHRKETDKNQIENFLLSYLKYEMESDGDAKTLKEKTFVDTSDTPDESNKSNNDDEQKNSKDDTQSSNNTDVQNEEPKDIDDGKEHPVLFWSTLLMIGGDLAAADKKGPRNYIYSMKGMYDNVMHYTYEEGLSENKLQVLLIKQIMKSGALNTCKIVTDKPFSQSWKGKLTDEFKVNKNSEYGDNEARYEFGGFTNKEIVSILNETAKADEVLKGNAKTIQLARTPMDKERLQQCQKEVTDAIQNEKSIQEYIKNSKTLNKTGIVSDDDNVDIDKANNLINICGNTRFAKKQKGGWFKRMINKLLNAIGLGNDDGSGDEQIHYDRKEIEKLNDLIDNPKKTDKENVEESYNSIQSYIKHNNKSLTAYLFQTNNINKFI